MAMTLSRARFGANQCGLCAYVALTVAGTYAWVRMGRPRLFRTMPRLERRREGLGAEVDGQVTGLPRRAVKNDILRRRPRCIATSRRWLQEPL